MMVQGENVPHFITKSHGEKNNNNSFLSRPYKQQIQNTIDIINSLQSLRQVQSSSSKTTTPSEKGIGKTNNQHPEPVSTLTAEVKTHHGGKKSVGQHAQQVEKQVLQLGELVALSGIDQPLNG